MIELFLGCTEGREVRCHPLRCHEKTAIPLARGSPVPDRSFDLIILGGGPGGYVAAIRARQLGLKTALVERDQLGGICLNWGCIPTKALLRVADLYRHCQHAENYGIQLTGLSFRTDQIVKRSRRVAAQLAGGVKHLLKKNGVEVVYGHGRLVGTGQLEVTDDTSTTVMQAPHIILATGARPRTDIGIGSGSASAPDIWTYKEAMVPPTIPSSLLVIGSGAIGIEFASFYQTLGSQVTVVEIQPRILPNEDEEISKLAQISFEKQGIHFYTQARVKSMSGGARQSTPITITLETTDGKEITPLTVDQIILAVGIVGNVEDIGLETTRVQVDRSHIVVDQWQQTAEEGIYAIGDVAGPPWLAHKASHEGVCVCRKNCQSSAGASARLSEGSILHLLPSQIASLGMTEHLLNGVQGDLSP